METVRSRSISIRIRITIRTTTMTSTGSVVSVHDLTMEDVTHEPDGERASSPPALSSTGSMQNQNRRKLRKLRC